MDSTGQEEQEDGWVKLAQPDDDETIENLLASLESRLQDDEAARKLLTRMKTILLKNKAEVGERSEREKTVQGSELESKSEMLECLLEEEGNKQGKEESSDSSSTLQELKIELATTKDELATTKALREEDKELIENLKKKVAKYKSKTADQLGSAQKVVKHKSSTADQPRSAKGPGIGELVYAGLFVEDMGHVATEKVLMQNEREKRDLNKKIKAQAKEVQDKESHIEKMSQKILDIKKEKEILEHKVAILSSAEAVQELTTQITQLQNELKRAHKDRKYLQTCLSQLKTELPSEKVKHFEFLTNEISTRDLIINELRQQTEVYETMISEYSYKMSREMGEDAMVQNEKQRRLENLQSQLEELNQKLMLTEIQATTFENDFKQERKDREKAHSIIADKNLQIRELQRQLSSQKQTESWFSFKQNRTQQMTAQEEERATALQQIKSYKQQADGYKKELETERERTSDLKREVERLGAKLGGSTKAPDVTEKMHAMVHELSKVRKERQAAIDDAVRLKENNKVLRRRLMETVGIVPGTLSANPEIPVAKDTVQGAAVSVQRKQEHQRGGAYQADEGGTPATPTEEHRKHVAYKDQLHKMSQEGLGSHDAMEMQIHSKHPVCNNGVQSSQMAIGYAQVDSSSSGGRNSSFVPSQSEDLQAGVSSSEQVISGGSKSRTSNPSNFTDGGHQPLRAMDIAKQQEPDETLIGENKLVAGIDQEIEDTASEVREMVKEPNVTRVQRPVGSFEIPDDPNLVCPKCGKSFKHGEIQKLRLHYHKCK